MSLCSRVSAAAARHAQLLDELEALHFDPKALPKETQLVHDLQEAINSAQNTLDALSQATKQDRESYLERNGNGLRRVMSRFLGANPEKCVKDLELEQKRYSASLIAETQCRRLREELSEELVEAQRRLRELQSTAESHEQLTSDLDNLYESIFGGEGSASSEDRRLQRLVLHADAQHEAARLHLGSNAQAILLLKEAAKKLHQCQSGLQDVLASSLPGERRFVPGMQYAEEVLGQNTIHSARACAVQADGLLNRAKQTLSSLKELPTLSIAQRSADDAFEERMLSRTTSEDSIRKSWQESYSLLTDIRAERQRLKAHIADFTSVVASKAASLSLTRADLRAHRQRAFRAALGACESTVLGGLSVPDPADQRSFISLGSEGEDVSALSPREDAFLGRLAEPPSYPSAPAVEVSPPLEAALPEPPPYAPPTPTQKRRGPRPLPRLPGPRPPYVQ